MATFLCQVDDIPESSGLGFEVGELSLVALRQGNRIYAYQNICPHLGTPLNWMPDQFVDYEKRHIKCSTHGALFETTTGLCIAGPCLGQHLKPVDINIIEGKVFLL